MSSSSSSSLAAECDAILRDTEWLLDLPPPPPPPQPDILQVLDDVLLQPKQPHSSNAPPPPPLRMASSSRPGSRDALHYPAVDKPPPPPISAAAAPRIVIPRIREPSVLIRGERTLAGDSPTMVAEVFISLPLLGFHVFTFTVIYQRQSDEVARKYVRQYRMNHPSSSSSSHWPSHLGDDD
ncbi:hypothetical protein BC828DRAFT_401461 [Blastocladiella britannica]|nr:hypothetical protein BC828DRAFT_401461 [Blastocladiella britannica]